MEQRQGALGNMVIDSAFWRGKTVFITGHTGFKGGWLSLWLQSLGANVVGYSLSPPTVPSLFELARVGEEMTGIEGDVRDFAHLQSVIAQHRPEIVIHMAAQSLVRHSYAHPVETYATNVMGTVNLLEAIRLVGGVRAVINITSDKCYENREWLWGYRENESMGGYDPYSNSKGCAELVTSAFRNSFFNAVDFTQHGVGLASVRAGNVIGGGDWAVDRLIPDIMRAIVVGQSVVIRSPHALRPWQHVLDPLSGYLKLAQKLYAEGPVWAEGWNFGPNDEDTKPVQWLVEHLINKWGENASWRLDTIHGAHEAHFLKLDCSKAKNRLSWAPRWSLEAALDSIVEWQRAYMQKADMRLVTLQQIKSYMQR